MIQKGKQSQVTRSQALALAIVRLEYDTIADPPGRPQGWQREIGQAVIVLREWQKELRPAAPADNHPARSNYNFRPDLDGW